MCLYVFYYLWSFCTSMCFWYMYVYIFMHVCVKTNALHSMSFSFALYWNFWDSISQWIQSPLNWLNWLVNKRRDSSIVAFQLRKLRLYFFFLNEHWQPKLMSLYLGRKQCMGWVTPLAFIHILYYVLIF